MFVSSQPRPLPVLAFGAALVGAATFAFAAASGSLTIVAGLLGIVATGAIVADWTLGIPILLFVSATDGFIKHLSSSSFTYVLKDALVALILLGLAVRLGLRAQERPDGLRWRGTLAWGVYIVFLTTQLVHPAATFAGALGAFRAHAWFALLFVIGAIYFQRRERLERTMNFAIGLCVVCALSAIVQHAMGDRWMHLSAGFMKASLHYTAFPSAAARLAGLNGATFRMYGTLVDPAALGLACQYGVLITIAALGRFTGLRRILTMIAIPIMVTGIALSEARADMAGLAGGVLVLILMAMRAKGLRSVAVGGLLLIALAVPAAVTLTNGTVLDRVLAQDSVAYAQATRDRSRDIVLAELPQYPFGHGLGAAGAGGNLRDDTGLGVDNAYFATLYETGIFGLGAFLFVQGTLIVFGMRAALRSKDLGARTVFMGIVAAQCALLVSCWFSQGPFDYAPIAQLFWLFSGAVARSDAWA
jgi:hypothetical protein